MAQKILVSLVDDLDGSEATQTVQFGFEGVDYNIDLNDKNAAELRKILTAHASVAQRVKGTRKVRGTSSSTTAKSDAGEAREWLRSQGHQVADRGRIPDSLMREYRQAMNAPQKPSEPQEEAPKPVETKPKTTRKPAARKTAAKTNVVEFKAADTDKPKATSRTTRSRAKATPKA